MPNKQADNTHDISTNNEPEEVQYERGKHPNSQSNLKPYPKGVSGNPLGRKGQFDRIQKCIEKLLIYSFSLFFTFYYDDEKTI